MNNVCPFCEKGSLSDLKRTERIQHNGIELLVEGFEFASCDHCHEEMVRADHARTNQRLIADAILSADGKFTTVDLKCFRLRHGLNQELAAQIFGGGANAFSKYERGVVQQSKAMDLLVRVYDQFPAVRDFLCARAGLDGASDSHMGRKREWEAAVAAPTHLRQVQRSHVMKLVADDQQWQDADIASVSATR